MRHFRMLLEGAVIAAFMAWLWIALVIGAAYQPEIGHHFGQLTATLVRSVNQT